MAIKHPSRKDMYNITVDIDGEKYGTFDTMTGGEIDSDELKYKPGGMAPEVSIGGSVTVGQVVLGRIYDLDRDHPKVHRLADKVGRGTVTVKKQPLDINRKPWGRALVYKGILKRVLPPEVDSTSTDAAILEIEVTPSGDSIT